MADQETLQTYASRAEEFAAQYNAVRPAFLSRVSEILPNKGRLLDIGSGSGRDMAAFLEEGFDVIGVEPVQQLRQIAIAEFPQLGGKIFEGSLPNLSPKKLGSFDAVHCSAVLMHLGQEELFNSIFTIRELLKPGGMAHLSYCPDRPGVNNQYRANDGRVFNQIDPDQFRAIIRRAGFSIRSQETTGDSLGRKGVRWISLFLERKDSVDEKPLLRIEQIVNHDTKDATYKLALLRALAEISNKHFHEVKWLAGGMVAVPASLVVDCWIRYYWPIFESPTFIPQKNGERPGCAKPVMFRDSMTSLIRTFSGSGSYAEFLSALDSDPSLGKQARTKVLNAIRQGPVVYSSGDLFSWYREGRKPFIKLSGKFWEELAEFSHWIEPAIRLRWAEETARFSKNELQTGEILSILSEDYEAERNVGFSRSVFNNLHGLKCTWTDASIRKFDIDHIIPYSLWHNNGLWNLVPARKQVNNQVHRGILWKI